jgi:hypothetical protein
MPPPPPAREGTPGINLGDKNVVGGDLVGSKHEVKVLGGSYTNITHSDETKKTRTCAISGRVGAVTEGHECPACRRWVVADLFNIKVHRCRDCDEERRRQGEREYDAKLREFYADNRIDDEERRALKRLAVELGITDERAQKLERAYREGDQSKLDEADLMRLKQAEKTLFTDLKVDEAHGRIEPLHKIYGRKDNRLWHLYMVSLAEFDPGAALQLIESLEVDDPEAYYHRIEIRIRQGQIPEAGLLIKQARQKFPDQPAWQVMEAECHMEEYRRDRDRVWLEEAGKCLGRGDLPAEWQWAAAKLAYLKDGERDAFNKLKARLAPGTLAYYRVFRAQKYLMAGPLKLHMDGQEHVCQSGDIIGRHGTVATSIMARINTLSRRHAEVALRGGQWHLRVLSTTNLSSMNGKPLETGRFYPLGLEQTIKLSSQCEFELRTTITT